MRACVDLAHVVPARSLARVSAFVSSDWGLDTLSGRFVELGGGTLPVIHVNTAAEVCRAADTFSGEL